VGPWNGTDLVCNDGSYINKFSGSINGSENSIKDFSFDCTNGSHFGPNNFYRNLSNFSSNNGFDKLNVTTDKYFSPNSIEFVSGNNIIGKLGNPTNIPYKYQLKCNEGKIMGLNTQSDGYPTSIKVICGKLQ
jgi:hypothetical protein